MNAYSREDGTAVKAASWVTNGAQAKHLEEGM